MGNSGYNSCFRFIYTTHPWLVSMYTDCPSLNGLPGQGSLHCPNNTALTDFEDGIKKGYIAWHVFPFNAEVSSTEDPLKFIKIIYRSA